MVDLCEVAAHRSSLRALTGGAVVRLAAPDACPFRRPFPAGFHGCMAFQPAEWSSLTTQYTPLPAVLTCGHLESAPARVGGFYGRCRLGDVAARAAWVAGVHADRLERIRGLQDDMAVALRELTETLWSRKGDQLKAQADGRPDDAHIATARLRRTGDAYVASARAFLAARSRLLDELSLPMGPVMALVEEALTAWIESRDSTVPPVSDEVLARFPEEAREFVRPRAAASSTDGAVGRDGT